MDFEKGYSSHIAGFTNLVANRPRRVYLAPGDSAKEMVMRMKSCARSENLCLPDIHVLSHEESWALYGGVNGGGDEARKIVKPYIDGSKPKRLYFLEDHYWEADKIRKIQEKMVINHMIVSHFLVMIGSGKNDWIPKINIEVFSQNYDLAYVLYHMHDRHKR